MNFSQFFNELRRRNVYKVAVTYAVVAWLAAQVVSLATSTFNSPAWVMQIVFVVLVTGFPVALVLAWAFEMSPEGMIRTASVATDENPFVASKKKPLTSILFIGFLLLVITGQFIYTSYWHKGGDAADMEKSIAVLPFTNESSDKENLYFCNGVMEGILDHLSKIADLTVISRSSVERFRNDRPSMKNMASELNARYLVEGSVQRIGDHAVIFAQLIYAEHDKHLWSKKYEVNLTDIFAVQAEITRSIADELRAIVVPDVKERIQSVPTADPIAYDYYLQGNAFFESSGGRVPAEEEEKMLQNAQLFYEQALNRDSTFAEAFVGLAKIEFNKNRRLSIFNDNYLDSVVTLVNHALAINPNLSEGYLLRSKCHYENSRMELAKEDLDKALELNPNDIVALADLAQMNMRVDLNFVEAASVLHKIERRVNDKEDLRQLYFKYIELNIQINDLERWALCSRKLESLHPDRNSRRSFLYAAQGNWDQVWALAENQPEELKNNEDYFLRAGVAHLFMQKYKEAVFYFGKWEELVNKNSAHITASLILGHRYGQALLQNGEQTKGMEMMRKHMAINNKMIDINEPRRFVALYDLAGIHSFLGNRDSSYYYLDLFEKNTGWKTDGYLVSYLKFDGLFDNIRNEERFQEMVERARKEQEVIQQQVRELLPMEVLKD